MSNGIDLRFDDITTEQIWLSGTGAALIAAGTAIAVVWLTNRANRKHAREVEARHYASELMRVGHQTLADLKLLKAAEHADGFATPTFEQWLFQAQSSIAVINWTAPRLTKKMLTHLQGATDAFNILETERDKGGQLTPTRTAALAAGIKGITDVIFDMDLTLSNWLGTRSGPLRWVWRQVSRSRHREEHDASEAKLKKAQP